MESERIRLDRRRSQRRSPFPAAEPKMPAWLFVCWHLPSLQPARTDRSSHNPGHCPIRHGPNRSRADHGIRAERIVSSTTLETQLESGRTRIPQTAQLDSFIASTGLSAQILIIGRIKPTRHSASRSAPRLAGFDESPGWIAIRYRPNSAWIAVMHRQGDCRWNCCLVCALDA